MPIEDVARAVEDLIREGKVKHFGLSDAAKLHRLEENVGAAAVELTSRRAEVAYRFERFIAP